MSKNIHVCILYILIKWISKDIIFSLCINLGFLRSRTQDEIRPIRDLLGEMLMKHKVGEGSRNRKRTQTVMQVWHLGKEMRKKEGWVGRTLRLS